jgi:hypothetical protein
MSGSAEGVSPLHLFSLSALNVLSRNVWGAGGKESKHGVGNAVEVGWEAAPVEKERENSEEKS